MSSVWKVERLSWLLRRYDFLKVCLHLRLSLRENLKILGLDTIGIVTKLQLSTQSELIVSLNRP